MADKKLWKIGSKRQLTHPYQSFILAILSDQYGARYFGDGPNLRQAAEELQAEGLITIGETSTDLNGRPVFAAYSN